ncbi:hypothetical protein EV360DRAFT_88555 [Lentinula raphanica]|nr:hypothetical protein EV360DRAFT_88555 [Lentinula raphanica]
MTASQPTPGSWVVDMHRVYTDHLCISVGPPTLPSPLRLWRPRPRDPEAYDFETQDTVPEDCAVSLVMATYGEGKPTDNAVQLMQNLQDDSFEFSKGGWDLSGLKYVVFGLGNKTHEHYNVLFKYVDHAFAEGDDDKTMEEDSLESKDGI